MNNNNNKNKVFSVNNTPGKFEKATIADLWMFFFLRKTRAGKSHRYRDVIVVEKSFFSPQRKAGDFKFLRFEDLCFVTD